MQCLQRVALKWKCLLLQGTKRCFSAVSRAWTLRTQMQHVIPSTSGWKMKQGVSIGECFLCMAGWCLRPLRFGCKYWGRWEGRKSSALQLKTVFKLALVWCFRAGGPGICSLTAPADVPAWWPWEICIVCVPICPWDQGSFYCSLPSYNWWEIQAEFSWSYAFSNIKDAFKQCRCLTQ